MSPDDGADDVQRLLDRACRLRDEGDRDGAKEAFQEAIDAGSAARKPRALEAAAEAAIDLALLVSQDPDHRSSEVQAHLVKAARCGEEAGTPDGLTLAARACLNLGVFRHAGGDPQAAREAWEEAVDHGEAAGVPAGHAATAGARFNLGKLAQQEGDVGDAIDLFEQAIEDARRSDGGRDEGARAAREMGNIHRQRGDGEAAKEAYRTAMDLGGQADNLDGHLAAAGAGVNLGVALVNEDDEHGARQAWEAAADHGARTEDPRGFLEAARASCNLGRLLAGRMDLGGAEAALKRAIELGERVEDAPTAVPAPGYPRKRDVEQAEVVLDDARELLSMVEQGKRRMGGGPA